LAWLASLWAQFKLNTNLITGTVLRGQANIAKAKSILQKLADEDDRILKDPATIIAVSELADNSVNIIVRPWTNSADYSRVNWDLTEKVKLTFDKEGISIPYPQRDVHLHQVA
jgi:small conductance mechanosensitive channel